MSAENAAASAGPIDHRLVSLRRCVDALPRIGLAFGLALVALLGAVTMKNVEIAANAAAVATNLRLAARGSRDATGFERWRDEQLAILLPAERIEPLVREAAFALGLQVTQIGLERTDDLALANLEIAANGPSAAAAALLHRLETGPLFARATRLDLRMSQGPFGTGSAKEQVDAQMNLRVAVRPSEDG